MVHVEIYTKTTCTFCAKAKAWFQEHDISYEEHDVSTVAAFGEMKKRLPEARTVPQILMDGHLIGGYDTLMHYEQPILERLRGTTANASTG
ncbi:glutaredoxin domain-containing protein [Roseospira visakhapatnamensis]|uniref:Glutaredoxin n=1 Tax=Roseospira visakhapatnamensis TaxID=390880 RepID=A0A7W6W979_9PROT|nr:glutaredoxin domain-containing protein [Roseospira visakhapatnamensis]MBB4265206.1 glutaredoxin [Roseospira visakhapatnamensis]